MQKAVNSAGEMMQKSMFMFDPTLNQQTTKFSPAAAQQFFSYLPQEMNSGGGPVPSNPLIAPYLAHQQFPISYIQEEPAQLRKLFIGGLNHETGDDQLKDYYSKWGQVVDCIVIRDPATKHSRGFGFVTYATIKMAENAMDARPHTINGKVVDPKRAIPREHMLPLTPNNPPHFLECAPALGCKLTLSSINWDFHTVDALRQYFEKFGEVEQVEIVGHPRGFGFIVFEERASAERCLQAGKHHAVNGRKVEVKECSNNNDVPSSTSSSSISQQITSKRQFNANNKNRHASPAQNRNKDPKKNEQGSGRPFVPRDNNEPPSHIDFPALNAESK